MGAYQDEFRAVTKTRLTPLIAEELASIPKGQAVRMRMRLVRKKCGRLKARLQLCQARGDDVAGRTSTLMDEVYRFMEDMEMPVYQAERAQRAGEAASQGTTQMPVQATVKGKCLTSSHDRKHPSLASPVAWTWPSDDIFSLFQAD